MLFVFAVAITLLTAAQGQLVGKEQTEIKPNITWQQCTTKGECSKRDGKITLDAEWRWLHQATGYLNCFEWSDWNTYNGCRNNTDCTKSCALDGADYKGTYSVTTNQSALKLQYVTYLDYATNAASRNFLMKDENTYEIFKLAPNREISFDADVSNLPCGLSGSLYFVAMDADGGMSRYPTNKAGAKYGTGYCDASCPRNLRFINGEANMEGWIPPEDFQDQGGGKGTYGSCCAELDLWDSNSLSTSLSAKPCTAIEQTRCVHEGCGSTFSQDQYQGVCDPDGCDFNPYRMGKKNFYGKGKIVDTSQKFTVVTQFIGSGEDLEIKRFYVQNGTVIQNPASEVAGVSGNSINSQFCTAQKQAFGDVDAFKRKGGMAQISRALERGMVMVFSIWDDRYANHLWLDSIYPPDRDPAAPGVARGECASNTGVPMETQRQYGRSAVTFSNIKFGDLNSTFG